MSRSRRERTIDVAVLLVALVVAAATAAVLVPAADAASGDGARTPAGGGVDAAAADRSASGGAHASSPAANDTASAGTAQPALSASDVAVAPGEAEPLELTLSEVPEGLSGYQLTLELSPAATASVADASYPDAFGYASTPDVGADGQSVTLEAADLRDEVTAGDADVTLATVDVRGEDAGEARASVTEFQIDADGGARIDPALDPGTIQVGADAPAGSSGPAAASAADDDGVEANEGGTDDGSESGDSSDGARGLAPANLAAVVVVALAMLCTVVITRRR